MKFQIKSLKFFRKQISQLDKKSKRIIDNKIQIIKQNPYRYKKLHSHKFSKVFRIRLRIKKQELRLIYVVVEPNIILVCLLDRGKDYKNLEKYLGMIR